MKAFKIMQNQSLKGNKNKRSRWRMSDSCLTLIVCSKSIVNQKQKHFVYERLWAMRKKFDLIHLDSEIDFWCYNLFITRLFTRLLYEACKWNLCTENSRSIISLCWSDSRHCLNFLVVVQCCCFNQILLLILNGLCFL